MTYTHLLDTNIVSNLIRFPNGIVRKRIEEVGAGSVCINLIIAAEIRFGCAKKNSERLTRQADAILDVLPILKIEEPVDREYAWIRSRLEARGTPIGPNDLFIAAHARQLGLTLVTANKDEFSRVEGLPVVNWLTI